MHSDLSEPLIGAPPILIEPHYIDSPSSSASTGLDAEHSARSIELENRSATVPMIQPRPQAYSEADAFPSQFRNVPVLSADDLGISPSYSYDSSRNLSPTNLSQSQSLLSPPITHSKSQTFSSTSPNIPFYDSLSVPSTPTKSSENIHGSSSDYLSPVKDYRSLPRSRSSSPSPNEGSSLRKLSSQSVNPSSSMSNFRGFKPNKTPISLQFNDVCLTLPNGQSILSGVTGHFPHSRLSAIMGPSGAGKTSFLNVLSGRCTSGTVTGSIKVNHITQSINQSSIKSLCGYVPQDDILHSDLTVYENLFYSAMLRLPLSMKHSRKLQIIDDVISMLGLTHVKDSLVGSVEKRGISGGQRKRVNIGCELVANVSILFMDEPTSGLDASAALEVLHSLRKLTDFGLTVITVIHQPRYRIFSTFHTVLLLGQGGRTVFLGKTCDALPYFESLGFELPEHENPADFYVDCIAGVVRERRIIDHATNQSKVVSVPSIMRSESSPQQQTLPLIDLLPSTTLQRTLSSSQSLRTVAALIIDMEAGHEDDDKQEPIIDFAEAWNEHRTKQEQAKKSRRESRASPEHRDRSLSGASDASNMSSPLSEFGPTLAAPSSGFAARLYAFWSPSERARQKRAKLQVMYSEFAEEFIVDEGDEAKSTTSSSTITIAIDTDEDDRGCLSFLWPKSAPVDDDDGDMPPISPRIERQQSGKHVFGIPKVQPQPSVFTQYCLLTRRLSLKLLRNWTYAVIDILLVAFLSLVVGWVYGSGWTLGEYTTQSVFSCLCMGVCATVASLRIFGADRLVYWRESLVGVSETAYFFALMTCELHRAFAYPAIFVACYLPLAQPQASFVSIYAVFVGLYFSMSGLGLLLSVVIRPVPALMVGTMLPLVIGGFLSGVNPPVHQMSPLMQFASNFSFTRWSVEAISMREASYIDVYGADSFFWWNQHFQFGDRFVTDIAILAAMGIGFRLATALSLRRFSRSQKL